MEQYLLFSWLGVEKDMINDLKVNTQGPTWNLYKYHYKNLNISRHYLLVTPEYYLRAKRFVSRAKYEFGYDIRIIQLEIDGVHWNLPQIKAKVESLLLDYRDYSIYIFFSTGSAIMKLAWYLVHTSLNINTALLQILKPEDSPDKNKPELFFLTFDKSTYPYSVLIREKSLSEQEQEKSRIILTDTLKEIYSKAEQIAQAEDISILILGETGTGKEELARYIHSHSPRKNKPFKAINCAAFSDQLLESRLFGHAKGSFTGAVKDHKGLFEQAEHGTVFLDEIGDVSPYMQQALLRFLQNKEIQPIGKQAKKVDVRVIAATNKSIDELASGRNFRLDLFYRFSVILELPPLYSFPAEEKLKIINFFLNEKSVQFSKPKLRLCREVKDFLLSYRFPGNIRELINIIDHFYIFATEEVACMEHLPYQIKRKPVTFTRLDDVEREHIKKIYQMFDKNKTRTARALGISLNTLKNKLKLYGIE
jgi:transcriptional regulator of acetoin/glycerol metabolism